MENPLFLLWPALAAVNIFSFALVGFDKKKSFEQGERSPEVLFFLLAVLFGSLGVFFGIFVFHHKTRKVYFPVGIGLMLIQQIALLYLLSKNFL